MKIVIIFFSLILTACGGSSNGKKKSTKDLQNVLVEMEAGTYAIGCFLNKMASVGFGSNVYTKSTMTLNSDGTGINTFELYDDALCTNLITSGNVTVLHYESVVTDGILSLQIDQDDGSSVSRYYIPYMNVQNDFYFDVDYSDGKSGPYVLLPTASDIVEFKADPKVQGVEVIF